MDKVYEVWIGWKNNNEDCYLRTTDIEEAKERANYFDYHITKEERKDGLFVEIRVPVNEYDYDTVEF